MHLPIRGDDVLFGTERLTTESYSDTRTGVYKLLLVHFPKGRYWVRPRSLPSYIIWNWHIAQQAGKRQLVRCLWSPTPAIRLPDPLQKGLEEARRLDLLPAWARYPTDGTRFQVFDVSNKLICKVLLPNTNGSVLASELAVRNKVGSMAPRLLALSSEADAYVEEWIAGNQAAYSVDTLAEILRKLQRLLYNVEWISQDEFLARLSKWGQISEEMYKGVCCAFSCLGKGSVPWSQVHGDLVEHNVLMDSAGEVVLIDWEHTRECVMTYDCWLYQYNHVRKSGLILSQFCKGLDRCISDSFGPIVAGLNAYSLHLLHLIERIHYLGFSARDTTGVIRPMMLSDIRAVYGELTGARS